MKISLVFLPGSSRLAQYHMARKAFLPPKLPTEVGCVVLSDHFGGCPVAELGIAGCTCPQIELEILTFHGPELRVRR